MTALRETPPIAIIGFGLSGLMVLANLLRHTTHPLTMYLVDPNPIAQGVAYSTRQPLHLLNVTAERMGAWAEDPRDFLRWLQSDAGLSACAAHALPLYAEGAFVPRMIYGAYLESIWREAQAVAAQKSCTIHLVPSRAVALQQNGDALAVLTERGDAIAAGRVVLAVGNEARSTHPVHGQQMLQPWDAPALAAAARTATSVALLGTGLTAVDAVVSLRAQGYTGIITALSRHGRLPQAHRPFAQPYPLEQAMLVPHATSVESLLRFIRRCVRDHAGDWHAVIDALRPHSHAVWRKLSLVEQRRFFRHLAGIWNVHRHRMAPQIAAMMAQEITAQQLRVIAARAIRISFQNDQWHLQWQGGAMHPDVLISCTGVSLNIHRSTNPLLRQLLEAGWIEPHGTDHGIAADACLRVYGHAHGQLYAIGSLLTGQCFESIAVPELRVQAQVIARDILG